MTTYIRFLYEFLQQFFSGFIEIFKGLFDGVIKIFNIGEYIKIIKFYQNDFAIAEWVLVALAIVAVLAVVGITGFFIFLFAKKRMKWKRRKFYDGFFVGFNF